MTAKLRLSPEFYIVQDKNDIWAVVDSGKSSLPSAVIYKAKTILKASRYSEMTSQKTTVGVTFSGGPEYRVSFVKSRVPIDDWCCTPKAGERDYESERLESAVLRCQTDVPNGVFPLARARLSVGNGDYRQLSRQLGFWHRPSNFQCGVVRYNPKVDMLTMRHRSGYQVELVLFLVDWPGFAQTPVWRLKTPTTIMWFDQRDVDRAKVLMADCACVGADVLSVSNNSPRPFLDQPWEYVNLRDLSVFSNTPDLPGEV